jgi:hypothetical protein
MHTATPTVLVSECPKGSWRQYQVITDERCVVVEMVPAMLCGWRFHRVIVQGRADWPGYTQDQIAAWKMDSRKDAYSPRLAETDAGFAAELAEIALTGQLPVA